MTHYLHRLLAQFRYPRHRGNMMHEDVMVALLDFYYPDEAPHGLAPWDLGSYWADSQTNDERAQQESNLRHRIEMRTLTYGPTGQEAGSNYFRCPNR